jgi:hypothetical protein
MENGRTFKKHSQSKSAILSEEVCVVAAAACSVQELTEMISRSIYITAAHPQWRRSTSAGGRSHDGVGEAVWAIGAIGAGVVA